MHDHDPQEQYSGPTHELYSRDKAKRALPTEHIFDDSSSLASTPEAVRTSAPLSASLQRASGSSRAPTLLSDAPPALSKRMPLRRRARMVRLVIITGLILALIGTVPLTRFISRQTSHSATSLSAQAVAATQGAVDRSTQATQTAVAVAPLHPYAAPIPGPCTDPRYWSYSYFINNPAPPPCHSDGVQLVATKAKGSSDAQFAPSITFAFPGGAVMRHYHVSLTFSALQTTPLTAAAAGTTCVALITDSAISNDSSITVCQDGRWSSADTAIANSAKGGRCAIDPRRGFTIQAQSDTSHYTYSCNNTPIAVYGKSMDITTSTLSYMLNAAFPPTSQTYSQTSSVTVADFSYTPLP